MQKQTISLCMITKNEEKYLEQCLSSVKEIAKNFKAKVFDFKDDLEVFLNG